MGPWGKYLFDCQDGRPAMPMRVIACQWIAERDRGPDSRSSSFIPPLIIWQHLLLLRCRDQRADNPIHSGTYPVALLQYYRKNKTYFWVAILAAMPRNVFLV